MTTFETGKTYQATSVCDNNCKWNFKIVRRTAKSVWIEDCHTKEIKRCMVKMSGNEEYIFPFGKYSMSPTLGAEKLI